MLVSTECHKDQANGHGSRPTRIQSERVSLKPANLVISDSGSDMPLRFQCVSPELGRCTLLLHLLDQAARLRG